MPKTSTAVKGPEAYSQEWYNLRKFNPDRKDHPVVFGASEAAAACGVSPYSSPLQLFLEKRGEFESDFKPEAVSRMDMGKRLEPVILSYYEEHLDCILTRDQPFYFHPLYNFMGATPDGIAYADGQEWSVDAKATNWRMVDNTGDDHNKFGESGTDQVPISILWQTQVQMAVLNMDRCDVPALIDGREFRFYTVQRNEELIQTIVSAEKELAERIINGDPPEPTWSHSGTKKVLQQMFGSTDFGKVAELSEADHDLWIRRQHLKEQIKEAEASVEEIDAKIAWAMQDAEIGRFPLADIELKKIVVKESFVPAYTRKGFSYFKPRKTG